MTTWSFCRLMLGIAWCGWLGSAAVAAASLVWPPGATAGAARAHGAGAVLAALALVLAQLWIVLFAALEATSRRGRLRGVAALAALATAVVLGHLGLVVAGVIDADLSIHAWISVGVLGVLAVLLVGERRWLAEALR